MNIKRGQGLLLKLPFADGGECKTRRTFLVMDVDEKQNKVHLLNVSSSRGKEHKLLFETNEELKNYNPPFNLPSFAKLDALYEIDYFPELEGKILRSGSLFNFRELSTLTDKFQSLKLSRPINTASYNTDLIKTFNF